RDHCRGDAVLSRRRHPTADADLGVDDLRGPRPAHRCLVGGADPGHRHHPDGALGQPVRRLAARPARSEVAPAMTDDTVLEVRDQLREAIEHRRRALLIGAKRAEVRQEAVAALRRVEIAAPEQRLGQYPHQMSGGMKQRVVGAIAISGQPEVLIADEPTTALDVTIQLQYLKLLKRLQQESGMAILFITHDFGVVARMCDRVAVMYAGRIVECGPVAQVFDNPSHPYTQALIASVPKMTGSTTRLYTIEGQPPSLMDLPAGCRFAARCPHAEERCASTYPPSFTAGAAHTADCWRMTAR